MRLTLALYTIILVVLPVPFWAANPFTPPEDVQLFYQVIYPDLNQKPVEYKMYMQNGNKIIALLNNTFVSEGDQFEGMKVMSINDKRVILLLADGEKYVVVIDAMQSKLQQLRDMLNQASSVSGDGED